MPTGAPRQGAHAGGSSGSQSTTETAKEEAANLGGSAKDAGRRVADTAKEEVRNVASEAKVQGKRLLDETMHEASEQAKTQQSRAAEGMHTFGGDLRDMASSSESNGMASQLVSEIGDRVDAAGRWLEQREPADVLDEVKTFARRRPGAFIAIAGVTGLLVGRLTRGMMTEAKEQREQSAGGAHAANAYRPTTTTSTTGMTSAVSDLDGGGAYGNAGGSLAGGPIDPVTGLPTNRRESGL